MIVPRPSSPRRALSDATAFFRARGKHQLIAGGLAIVVPALYLLFPGRNRGGYSTSYATEHLGAHWVTVAAVLALATALVWQLAVSRARARRDARAAGRAGEAGPR